MNLLTCALAAAAMSSSVAVSGNAPKMEIWQDPGVFERKFDTLESENS